MTSTSLPFFEFMLSVSSLWSFPIAFRQFMRPACLPEELDQGLEIRLLEMPELTLVTLLDCHVEIRQQLQAARRDADFDDAAIVCRALAVDDTAFLQLIEQAGDVGGAGHQAAGEDQSGHLARMFAAEQAHRVVLLWRQLVPAE